MKKIQTITLKDAVALAKEIAPEVKSSEIARILGVSEYTIRSHKGRI